MTTSNHTMTPEAWAMQGLKPETRKRIMLERRIVSRLITELAAAGYAITQVWDGERYVKTPTESIALDAVWSVDESTIHFDGGKGANGHGHGVLIILGNGTDVISDNHCGDADFAAVVDKVGDWAIDQE